MTASVHAGCILIGEAGILIRGASGSGKSRLALRLISLQRSRRGFARLVADDRVVLSVSGGRLIARPSPVIAGRTEVRGLGILAFAHEPAAVVRLVVDCDLSEPVRFPADADRQTSIEGVVIDRISVFTGPGVEEVIMAALEVDRGHA